MVRTPENLLALVENLEAIQCCRNIMGRFIYYNATYRNLDVLPMWAERDDCLVEMPWGLYRGRKGVKDFLVEQGDRRDPNVHANLKGVMRLYELQSELIEVAEDGKTAQGIWSSPGEDTHLECWAPIGEWRWCRYAVDFIRENGEWKIWKLRMLPIFRTNYYRSWVKEDQPKAADYGYSLAESKAYDDWSYDMSKPFPADYPEPPKPYAHYEDTEDA